jgi:hypothetical protein
MVATVRAARLDALPPDASSLVRWIAQARTVLLTNEST